LLLADYGASVLRIDRPLAHPHDGKPLQPTADLLTRRKSSVAVNLKSSDGQALLEAILLEADILLDPFRPGVLESLSLSPHQLLAKNPRLIIARLTGFRRDGQYAAMAGHDINYLAVSGILSQLGRVDGSPYPPANILADFAGGGLMCALGILLALLERTTSGKGQVVENNMVDGVGYLGSMMRFARRNDLWNRPRGQNLLDGGCPWYDVYPCKDGGHMAVGALEPHFFRRLVQGLELPELDNPVLREDRTSWPAMRDRFRRRFLEKTRSEWENIFNGADACCTPVLDQRELEDVEKEQRLPVDLQASPGFPLDEKQSWTSAGLAPGTGGPDILDQWFVENEARLIKWSKYITDHQQTARAAGLKWATDCYMRNDWAGHPAPSAQALNEILLHLVKVPGYDYSSWSRNRLCPESQDLLHVYDNLPPEPGTEEFKKAKVRMIAEMMFQGVLQQELAKGLCVSDEEIAEAQQALFPADDKRWSLLPLEMTPRFYKEKNFQWLGIQSWSNLGASSLPLRTHDTINDIQVTPTSQCISATRTLNNYVHQRIASLEESRVESNQDESIEGIASGPDDKGEHDKLNDSGAFRESSRDHNKFGNPFPEPDDYPWANGL
ncbi:MAG: hypothetical protein Q9198_002176, partial [Flavoplaca austrocitrina]